MELYNETRDAMIASRVSIARNPWSRFRGLMLRRSLPEGHALILDPGNGIHSFFMRFAFDAIFVDADWTVRYIVRGMRPWRMTRFVRGTKRVIEVPVGTCVATATAVGDSLSLRAGSGEQAA